MVNLFKNLVLKRSINQICLLKFYIYRHVAQSEEGNEPIVISYDEYMQNLNVQSKINYKTKFKSRKIPDGTLLVAFKNCLFEILYIEVAVVIIIILFMNKMNKMID